MLYAIFITALHFNYFKAFSPPNEDELGRPVIIQLEIEKYAKVYADTLTMKAMLDWSAYKKSGNPLGTLIEINNDANDPCIGLLSPDSSHFTLLYRDLEIKYRKSITRNWTQRF